MTSPELLLKLIKQDDDGPSLELALGFSVSLNYFSPINQDTVALGSLALYDVKSLGMLSLKVVNSFSLLDS